MEMLDGLNWREIGFWSALLIYVVLNHWRDLAGAARQIYDNHARHVHDKREFAQSMGERQYDHKAQADAARLSHKIALDHEAFDVVRLLLEERQDEIRDIQRSLLEILKLLAAIQQAGDLATRRYDQRLENIGASLRLAWQEMQRIREELLHVE